MPKFEVIVKTQRGIFTYGSNKPKEEFLPTILNKHKYDCVQQVKFHSRITS